MSLASESGLKVAARISARGRPNILKNFFEDSVVSKFGTNIVDFAFPKTALLIKQHVVFDIIFAQTFPPMINSLKTGGLDGECVLINTDSSFSVISFVLYLEKFMSSRFQDVSNSTIVDKVLNRLHVINARTTAECILALLTLRNFMHIDEKYLLIIDSVSTLFGYIPCKEMTITRSVFFYYLKHVVETFSMQCICFRMLNADQGTKRNAIPFYYHPRQCIIFRCEDHLDQKIKVEITDGTGQTFFSHFRTFSKL